jgi:hypothetical protein
VSSHTFDFSRSILRRAPFPYVVLPKVFSAVESNRLLEWLESSRDWEFVAADFYDQYEFDVATADIPRNVPNLNSADSLHALARECERLFQVRLSERVDLTAHKLTVGQTIRIHNDHVVGQETHRLLVQLNRDWIDSDGGLLMLFDSDKPEGVTRVIRPLHNSAVGFEISPRSHHAVSHINRGQRFTLVYSFYAPR